MMNTGWKFDNSYAALPDTFFTRLNPVPVAAPKLAVLNDELAGLLGLDAAALRSAEGAEVFAGNRVPEGAAPLAQAYAGHQFGGFTMLGDGRAILLGEQITPTGERFDIQLKGSGRTPYSRGGDGRAALGPMLREYIISEAMHALGIPTTRSLAVVTTGEQIVRERLLPGAILTRVASSHLRVGTFQYIAHWGSREELRTLADYALQRHDPEVDRRDPQRFLQLLEAVMGRQASLIAKWQLVGFIHGVMNTDNMAISGETIDYGPCAFMDTYDPGTVFSSIDRHGRYAYGNQPRIALWNLARFAETLLPLLHDEEEKAIELAEETLGKFSALYKRHWLSGMRAKLGFANEEPEDEELVEELLTLMHGHGADYTNTFRALTLDRPDDTPMAGTGAWTQWLVRWRARLLRQPALDGERGNGAYLPVEATADSAQPPVHGGARRLMTQSNPAVIPRNHRVEEALSAAVEEGDLGVMERLLDALDDPYAYSSRQDEYTSPPPSAARPYVTFCGT